jgi:hypothetical protein
VPSYDLSGVSVMLAMPAHRDIPVETAISLVAIIDKMNAIGMPFEIQIQKGGSIIEWARSRCVHLFLQSDKNRLFWMDSDIVCQAEDFVRIVALSTKLECIGAVYPAKTDDMPFYLNLDGDRLESDEHGCLPIGGIGLGFCCVQRDVIEKLAATAPLLKMQNGEEMRHLFRCDSKDGVFRGEDMAFCADIRALGYQVKFDPAVKLGHVGPKVYSADIRDSLVQTTDGEAVAKAA